MIAVFKREFKSYFTNMIGYAIIAVLFFIIALHFCMNNIRSGYPYFGYALNGVENYLMIVIPILTMKSLSDERKSKTDQLLLTSPASITQIVVGKFIGMVAVFAIPMLFSCIFPIILSFKESSSLIIDYSSIFAFFLMGCVYIAVGMFISSLTESQIIAAVVSFIVFFVFFLSSFLVTFIPSSTAANQIGFVIIAGLFAVIVKSVTKNIYAAIMVFMLLVTAIYGIGIVNPDIYVNSVRNLISIVSLSNGITFFAYGIFDVKSIVLFVSSIILFVFLTVQSVQKRRYN